MNAARMARLRKAFSTVYRFAANVPQESRAKGVYAATHPEREAKAQPAPPTAAEPKPRGWKNWSTNFSPWGGVVMENDVTWIELPDPQAKPTPKPRRIKKRSALANIADQSGKKLPKLAPKYAWQTTVIHSSSTPPK